MVSSRELDIMYKVLFSTMTILSLTIMARSSETYRLSADITSQPTGYQCLGTACIRPIMFAPFKLVRVPGSKMTIIPIRARVSPCARLEAHRLSLVPFQCMLTYHYHFLPSLVSTSTFTSPSLCYGCLPLGLTLVTLLHASIISPHMLLGTAISYQAAVRASLGDASYVPLPPSIFLHPTLFFSTFISAFLKAQFSV